MYPSRFRYEAPRTIDEAIELLHAGAGEAKVLAGGQSLVPLMKLRFASPDLLVDINNLPDLAYHRMDADGALRIGALCRHAALERSGLLAERQPTMAAAAPLIADPIVRNRGTLVGSLCHADPQGDWASVVTALGGHVVARGPNGTRTIPVGQFVTGPFQNVLAYDEIAVEASFPVLAPGAGVAFQEIARRHGDYALVGVAAHVETDGDTVTRARLGFVSVSDVPTVVDVTDALDDPAGQALADLDPADDIHATAAYRAHLVKVLAPRVLAAATDHARSRAGEAIHP